MRPRSRTQRWAARTTVWIGWEFSKQNQKCENYLKTSIVFLSIFIQPFGKTECERKGVNLAIGLSHNFYYGIPGSADVNFSD